VYRRSSFEPRNRISAEAVNGVELRARGSVPTRHLHDGDEPVDAVVPGARRARMMLDELRARNMLSIVS
jgi:hypothetical protein